MKSNCDVLFNNNEPEPENPLELNDDEKQKLSKLIKKEFSVEKDQYNLKNAFMCKSNFEVRLSLDKDPRKHKGNTDYIDLYQSGESDFVMYNHLDNGMTYNISKNVNGVSQEKYIETSLIDKYDYVLDSDTLNSKRSDGKEPHKEPLPLSFIQINNERDGALWYKEHYPKIPDDLIPIIARYHWGEPITKKSIKNEKKKIIKKAGQKGLKIENKKVSITFD